MFRSVVFFWRKMEASSSANFIIVDRDTVNETDVQDISRTENDGDAHREASASLHSVDGDSKVDPDGNLLGGTPFLPLVFFFNAIRTAIYVSYFFVCSILTKSSQPRLRVI